MAPGPGAHVQAWIRSCKHAHKDRHHGVVVLSLGELRRACAHGRADPLVCTARPSMAQCRSCCAARVLWPARRLPCRARGRGPQLLRAAPSCGPAPAHSRARRAQRAGGHAGPVLGAHRGCGALGVPVLRLSSRRQLQSPGGRRPRHTGPCWLLLCLICRATLPPMQHVPPGPELGGPPSCRMAARWRRERTSNQPGWPDGCNCLVLSCPQVACSSVGIHSTSRKRASIPLTCAVPAADRLAQPTRAARQHLCLAPQSRRSPWSCGARARQTLSCPGPCHAGARAAQLRRRWRARWPATGTAQRSTLGTLGPRRPRQTAWQPGATRPWRPRHATSCWTSGAPRLCKWHALPAFRPARSLTPSPCLGRGRSATVS